MGVHVVSNWLHAFARDLRHVDDYATLVNLVRSTLHTRFGLSNAWLYVFERDEDEHAVLVGASGTRAEAIWKELPIAPIAGDWLIAALRRDEGPIVIPDATLVEGNPDVAQRLGNRTVLNMPIGVLDKALGILGGGTFGDEGPVALDEAAVSDFTQLSHIASVAVARMVLRARDKERAQLQAQLAQRQRLESLGLLAGGVAHDFNNLLMVIRASVGFLARGSLTDAQRSDLDRIGEAEKSAAQLTRKLLMLGHQEPPSFQSADINAIISDFLQLLERVIPAHIQTDFVGGAALPRLRVDRHQLEQVLMNLALNARDAMPNGGRLAIETQQVVINGDYRRAHPWAKPGRYVLLSVTDSGTGMSAEVRDRVFEPFFTTKPQGQGTGLGMAVTWGIVQQHDGMIHCYSEIGVGTAFKIYLPAGDISASDVGSKITGAVPRGSERVLLADDQPHVLSALARVLSGAGYVVTPVSNGQDAVIAAIGENFSLHILDSVMPLLNGREAFERIRAQRPEAKFLFTTGYGGDTLPDSFLEEQGLEVVQKPFDPDTLLRIVRAKLDSK
ncbi:MAG TPA: ATP-binding protein [Polyangiaceae bacterium]|nr:ATP-binding protein [Polyangiaceae bacterium]